MSTRKTRHPTSFKTRVALDAVQRDEQTSAELASHYQIHHGLIRNWKTILVNGAPDLFAGKSKFSCETVDTRGK